MEPVNPDNISLDQLSLKGPDKNNIDVFLLRLDKIHPEISGNKWFKLKFYLSDALTENKKTIITFGGAWSNHILATAAACNLQGLQSIGIIRGEKPHKLSYTLKKAAGHGMKLCFISRDDYRQKIMPAELEGLKNSCIINEGGYGKKGMEGAATIAEYYTQNLFTHICCAVGTGTMIAGLINAAKHGQEILGFSILKNNLGIEQEIQNLLSEENHTKKYSINHEYHFGGYAKHNATLIDFMNEFYWQTGVPTDFVYTGKLLYGIHDLLSKNFFPHGSRILIIHSGGLQGNNSLPKGTLIF
jgi:1-aminocyclopropane-1-carboxylate deaminase